MYRLAIMHIVKDSQTDRQTDRQTDGRTDYSIMPIADSHCVAVRSSKNALHLLKRAPITYYVLAFLGLYDTDSAVLAEKYKRLIILT